MCKYKSAIVVLDKQHPKGFKVLLSPWTESHSDLCSIFKLNDEANARLYFARIEFSPESLKTAHLVKTYKLHIDEERTPEWFSKDIKDGVTEHMLNYIRSIIVYGDVELLIGGQFVLAPNAKVACAKTCVINAMLGSSKVDAMRDSSKVDAMRGSSKVGEMYDSSNVGAMYGSSNVGAMCGSSKVGEMYDSSKVGAMCGSSNVDAMYGSSNVGEMGGSSNVGEMGGSSNVGAMYGSSKVGVMSDSSNVGAMYGSSKVDKDSR